MFPLSLSWPAQAGRPVETCKALSLFTHVFDILIESPVASIWVARLRGP